MSLLNIGIGDKAPEIVNVIIEIPKGSTNKYEVDLETGAVWLDRVLYSPLFYPFDYGYIPQTRYLDGDPIDALVLLSHPTFPGCVLEAKPIGVLSMTDEKGPDEKIICVSTKDPRFSTWTTLEDLNEHVRKEVVHFFEVYKSLEEKAVNVLGWRDLNFAHKIIKDFKLKH
jgi:inorganic pyrophosphatase